jgi:hypothetical protein
MPVVNSSLFAFHRQEQRVYEDIERGRPHFQAGLRHGYAACMPIKHAAQTEAVKGKRTCFVNFTGDTKGLSPALVA